MSDYLPTLFEGGGSAALVSAEVDAPLSFGELQVFRSYRIEGGVLFVSKPIQAGDSIELMTEDLFVLLQTGARTDTCVICLLVCSDISMVSEGDGVVPVKFGIFVSRPLRRERLTRQFVIRRIGQQREFE